MCSLLAPPLCLRTVLIREPKNVFAGRLRVDNMPADELLSGMGQGGEATGRAMVFRGLGKLAGSQKK